MAQARAVRLHGFGEPEVMGIETLELAAPGAGEVQIPPDRHRLQLHRRLPAPRHLSAPDPDRPWPRGGGRRRGGRSRRHHPEARRPGRLYQCRHRRLCRPPRRAGRAAGEASDSVSDEAAASLIFKGLTAQYLLRKTHRVGPGDLILSTRRRAASARSSCAGARRSAPRSSPRPAARRNARWPSASAPTTRSTIAIPPGPRPFSPQPAAARPASSMTRWARTRS